MMAHEVCSNRKTKPKFNTTNENIDWAKWTWNPLTGCTQGCRFCYARDIARRFASRYPFDFQPTFHSARLSAPRNTNIPQKMQNLPGIRNVFTCSMGDLFGPNVEQYYIDLIIEQVREAPQWNFLFLTKFPERLLDVAWPANSWVGATVHRQDRVTRTMDVFKNLVAPVKFISCEPLQQKLTFKTMEHVDWVIIGAQSRTTGEPAMQPERVWVESLNQQARAAGCRIYHKPNLVVPEGARLKEYPDDTHAA